MKKLLYKVKSQVTVTFKRQIHNVVNINILLYKLPYLSANTKRGFKSNQILKKNCQNVTIYLVSETAGIYQQKEIVYILLQVNSPTVFLTTLRM